MLKEKEKRLLMAKPKLHLSVDSVQSGTHHGKKIYFIKCPELLAYLCSAICHWKLLDMWDGNFSAFIIGNVGMV